MTPPDTGEGSSSDPRREGASPEAASGSGPGGEDDSRAGAGTGPAGHAPDTSSDQTPSGPSPDPGADGSTGPGPDGSIGGGPASDGAAAGEPGPGGGSYVAQGGGPPIAVEGPAGADAPAEADSDRPLPEQVRGFLVELSSALQKHAMYPDEHPALKLASDDLLESLQELLGERPNVMVTSQKGRLFVDDGCSDPDQPLLSGLAARLHDHQVLSLTFRRGVGLGELNTFLRKLSEEVDRGGEPLGLASTEVLKAWSHIDVQALRYDPLETGEREEGLEATDAWREEMRAEYDTEIGGVDLLEYPPEAMARSVERQMGDEVRDRMMAVELFRLAEQLSNARGRSARKMRQRMSEMIFSLPAETMEQLLEMGREGGREGDFLVDAAGSLDTRAVVELVQAAAAGGDRDVAQPMLRLLTKLSMYSEHDAASAPDAEEGALKNLVQSMVDDWSLPDPNPQAYDSFLDQMSHRPPSAGPREADGEAPLDPDRMLKMGLELDEWTPAVREAGDALLAEERAGDLLEMLAEADEGSVVRERVWDRIARPEVVESLVRRETPPWGVLERIVDRAGVEVADPLLRVLALSGSRSVRRRAFGLLTSMGPGLAELVTPYLEDDRWFVRRNMLALLAELDAWPEDFSPRPFLEDEDARVRGEALKVAIGRPDHRTAALRTGLEDGDERVLSLALSGAERDCPEELEPLLAHRAANESLSEPLRTTAVRGLANRGTDRARDALLEVIWVRRWFFWRRLAPATNPVRAAVRELAARWPDHPRVVEAVERAAEADDEKLRETALEASEARSGPAADERSAAERSGPAAAGAEAR